VKSDTWQVRAHWDRYKNEMRDDRQTKAFSNSLRSLQDFYLRTLWEVYQAGRVRLLASFLHPEFALEEFKFVNLNPATLTYENVVVKERDVMMRRRLAARTVRIAFEALAEYCAKGAERRKMVRPDFENNSHVIRETVSQLSGEIDEDDLTWQRALTGTAEEIEQNISTLLVKSTVPTTTTDEHGRKRLQHLFDRVGLEAEIDFSRYDDSFS